MAISEREKMSVWTTIAVVAVILSIVAWIVFPVESESTTPIVVQIDDTIQVSDEKTQSEPQTAPQAEIEPAKETEPAPISNTVDEQDNTIVNSTEVTLPDNEQDVLEQPQIKAVLECSVPGTIEESAKPTLSAIFFDMDLRPLAERTITWSISPGSYNFTSTTQADGTTELIADLSELSPGLYGVSASSDDGSASCAESLLVTNNHGSRGGNPDTIKPALAIVSPTAGDNIGGPTSGVIAHITGTSSDDRSDVGNVQVRWDAVWGLTGYRTAAPTSSDDWSSWSYDIKFSTEGSKRALVKSTDGAGNKSWKLTTFDVSFATDNTKPLIAITSPTYGSEFEDTGIVNVQVTGTASDLHSDVQMVEVRTDLTAYILATPNAPGDWSSWQSDLTFASDGPHQITARVTDSAGNTQWQTIEVTILPAEA